MGLSAEAQIHKPHDDEEQAGNVHIQGEGGKHVLLGRDFKSPMFPTQDEHGIKYQELQKDTERMS